MLQPKIYSKKDKKVLEVIEIDFDYKVIVVRSIDNSENNNVGTLNFSDVQFMDNTGFKDKNGANIYTGEYRGICAKTSRCWNAKRSDMQK